MLTWVPTFRLAVSRHLVEADTKEMVPPVEVPTVGRAIATRVAVSRSMREQSVVDDPAETPLWIRTGFENWLTVGVNTKAP
jgi:hypothetical protein